MIRFIHTADIHFGVENYGKIDQETGLHTRLLDFQKALNQCVDYAINNSVDFFLFCGDAYKTTTPSPTQQRLFFQCFLRLFKANIPVVMVVGNHDNPLSFGKTHSLDLFGQLPLNGFYVLDKPSTLQLQTKSGPVQIIGIPWPSRHYIPLNTAVQADSLSQYIGSALTKIIAHHTQKLDPNMPAVLAGHLTVSSGLFSGSEKRAIYGTDPIILPSDLAKKPLDYVALGHLHRYQNLNPKGHPAIVYAGSLERIDFGERNEEKGFCDVTIHHKNKTEHRFIPTTTRPCIQIDVKLQPNRGQTDQILDALKLHDLTNAIVKLVYHIPQGCEDTVDLKTIGDACKRAHDVIGIFPIHHVQNRTTRSDIQSTLDVATALTRYLNDKKTPPETIERLQQKLAHLMSQDY